VSFSLTSAGSPGVPRLAEGWIRGTALAALDACVDEVDGARVRALDLFLGTSGQAYSVHTMQLLLHLQGLRSRFVRAADLFGSYADRLVAHETLLAGVRARALAAGLEVAGDLVLPPEDPSDLVAGKTWSDLAGLVADEQHDLLAWVSAHLEGAVESFADETLLAWVRGFVESYHSTLISAGGEGLLTKAGQLASRYADDLTRLGRLPGPIGLAYDAVTALEGDTPAEGLFVAGVGFATATVAVATLPVTVPTVAVAGVTVLATVGGALVAQKAWDRLPDEATDVLDQAAKDAWVATTDIAADAWDEATDIASDRWPELTDLASEGWDEATDLASAGLDELRSWR
jgi:hypothetical protein